MFTASTRGYHKKRASAVTTVRISALHNIEGDDCEQQQTAEGHLAPHGAKVTNSGKEIKKKTH